MSEIEIGQKFGQLEVLEQVTLLRCGCMKCGSDSVLASDKALNSGTVRMCFDCAEYQRLTPEQKTVIAFRRSLSMSPEPLPIGWVA